jgi:hypothetical protein
MRGYAEPGDCAYWTPGMNCTNQCTNEYMLSFHCAAEKRLLFLQWLASKERKPPQALTALMHATVDLSCRAKNQWARAVVEKATGVSMDSSDKLPERDSRALPYAAAMVYKSLTEKATQPSG